MNSENFRSLGCVEPPTSTDDKTVPTNSFSVNQYGDIALLRQDGKVVFSTLSGDDKHVVYEKPIDYEELLISNKFTGIEFSEDGTILMLWSEKSAGILEIPRNSAYVTKSGNSCVFSLIGQDYMSSSSRIIKASFHPMGSSHVVILMNGSLLLIDISNPNGDTEFYPLGIKDHFISYCFGPSIDWMKFSIFLLSDKKSDKAEVFCLCPVIPKDISVPKSSVRDLWAWVDEQVVFREEHNTSGEVYLERVRQYLTAAFGPRNILEKEDKLGKSASSFILSRGGLYTETEALLFAAPSLQGPFSLAESGAENMNNNNWEVIPNKSDEKAKRKACDICTPRTRGEGAPLIVVSFDNGDVDFLVLGCESADACVDDVQPSWLSPESQSRRNDSSSSAIGTYNLHSQKKGSTPAPPGLVLVERVPVGKAAIDSIGNTANVNANANSSASASVGGCWTLLADPVVSHCFHATNYSSGKSYLLSSLWLLKTIDGEKDNGGGRGERYNERDGNGDGDRPPSPLHYSGSPFRDPGVRAPSGPVTSSACPKQYPTTVTPVLALTNSDTKPGRPLLAGFTVGYDHVNCFLRHTALFRSDTGRFTEVDLTLHMRLCNQHAAAAEKESAFNSQSSRVLMPSIEGMSWQRVTQDLLTKAAEGLQNIPQPSGGSSDATMTSIQCSKALLLASEHMEARISAPLQELSRRIRYRVDVLKDTYAAQLELLEGSHGDASADSAVGSGLNARLSDLSARHEDMQARVAAIQERTVSQQQRMAEVYRAAIITRAKFSQAEKNHHQQLLEWCSLLKHMDIGVDSLRRQVREQTRKNQPQSLSIVQQGRLGGTGSARKPFPPPAGPSTYYPSTPGTVRAPTESVPMTPTSDRGSNPTSAMKQVSMGYRSPGFGSGPVYAYSANKDSFGSPTPQSVPGSANRPRRSAYMAQASPAGKTLSFGSVGNNVSLPYNSVGSGRKFVGASLSSPMPAQNQMMQSLVQSQERLDKFAVQDESMDSQVHSLEGHLNVQQNVLEISDANLGALEERVSTMKGRVKHS